MTCPAASEARNTTSGAFRAGSCSGGGADPDRSKRAAVMRVAPAGATALTVIPERPSSSAQMKVSPMRAALAAP